MIARSLLLCPHVPEERDDRPAVVAVIAQHRRTLTAWSRHEKGEQRLKLPLIDAVAWGAAEQRLEPHADGGRTHAERHQADIRLCSRCWQPLRRTCGEWPSG